MNATLKSIQQLLYHPDVDLRLAAIQVLRAINSHEAGVLKTLADLMVETDDPEIFEEALETVEQSPHEQILRQLVRALDKGDEYQDRILDAIAMIGPKAVQPLKQQFEKVPPETQRRMIRVLPRIRTHQAHVFFVDALAHPDLNLMREAIRALREEIGKYSNAEKNDLLVHLQTMLKDKRIKQNEAALSAIIIAMGIIADLKSKGVLLSFVSSQTHPQARRYALIGLAGMPLSGTGHADIVAVLYPLLDDPDYQGLVRHALAVLECIAPARDDQDRLRGLLKNRHPGVRIFAMGKLTELDSPQNAQLIMEFLSASDQAIKEAAIAALSRMPSSVTIILKTIDDAPSQIRTQDAVRILSQHANRITPERARNRVKRMLELHRKNDRHFELHWDALKSLRPDILQAEILKLADEAFAASDYASARSHLKLLAAGGLLNSELRYKLMLASLKTSEKSRSRGSRASDPSLDHAAKLLAEDPKDFKRRLLVEKILDDEDFLYLGYHFSERLNEERRFGADLLRHVVSRWPRRQSAKAAKQKLQVEGH
ncbi:MAG: HEAT repeat domain-containing protein [Planctomycetota bacterium]|nr:HEAT repeat domain-containing protein [Planctomycetota bacterium]